MPIEPEQKQPDQPFDEVYASWEYPDYLPFERGWRWYLGAVLVAVLFIVYGIYTRNYFFVIIVVMAVGIFMIANRRQPEAITFALTDRGVVLKDRMLGYSEIKNFWIIYQPPVVKTLFLEPKSVWQPRIHVHLMDQNPVEVRNILLQYLQEDLDKEEEPQSETWGRLFKF